MGKYVEVITELALDNSLTYSVPDDNKIEIGARVVVTVTGRRHFGIVVKIHTVKPPYRVLPVKEVIDTERTFVTENDIELWRWVASYYMCSLGTVYKAALPHSIRTNTFAYSSEQYVKLKTSDDLVAVLDSLKRAPSQSKTLLRYIELAENDNNVSRSKLLNDSTAVALNELCKKGVLEVYELQKQLPKFTPQNGDIQGDILGIYNEIQAKHAEKDIVLLHETTLIDKFTLYARLAEDMALKGKQLLILTPDGFTAESIYEKLSNYFAGGVVAYHPNMTDVRRSRAYAQARDEATVIVGSRGAVFVPMDSLGMVVVEQEHDFAYKNSDSSPRLNVRDTALVKAARASAKVLLCSETPAVESYYNATRGAWGYVKSKGSESRDVSFIVLERGKELLSKYLRRKIEEVIIDGKQALIFQNRRGFSQWVECPVCFDTPTCKHCNVSLTYHKVDNSLRCHYCGYQQPFTGLCSACGSEGMMFQGRGTERIEESLKTLFPDAKIERIDYDSTRGKGAFEQIAASIATDCNIIVGTQMVVRGIDFSKVGLIGIANADNMLSQSDFRTSERAHSLLTMLSNRITNGGEVVIQTTKRLDDVITSVEKQNHTFFYEAEIAQRKMMNYPPSVRMIKFTLSHRSREQLFDSAKRFEALLRPTFGNRISPPFEPSVDRIQDHFFMEFYLRIERERSVVKAKELVRTAIASTKQASPSLNIFADVDPL